VTATKTRKKQQTELIECALKAEEDRKRSERENFRITTVPVTVQASYEPALHHPAGDDHDDDGNIPSNITNLIRTSESYPRNRIESLRSLVPSLSSPIREFIPNAASVQR